MKFVPMMPAFMLVALTSVATKTESSRMLDGAPNSFTHFASPARSGGARFASFHCEWLCVPCNPYGGGASLWNSPLGNADSYFECSPGGCASGDCFAAVPSTSGDSILAEIDEATRDSIDTKLLVRFARRHHEIVRINLARKSMQLVGCKGETVGDIQAVSVKVVVA